MDSSSSDGGEEEEDYDRFAQTCVSGLPLHLTKYLFQYTNISDSYELHDLAENGEITRLGEVIGCQGQESIQSYVVHTLLLSFKYGPYTLPF